MKISHSNLNIDKFRTYLKQCGAQFEKCTNMYEVIRFRSNEGVGIVYTSSKASYTITGSAITAFDFFKNKKKWKATKEYESWERPIVYNSLIERDGNECFYCGGLLDDDATIEHMLSIVHGGPNNLENLCLTHAKCNLIAGSLPLNEKIKLFFNRKK